MNLWEGQCHEPMGKSSSTKSTQGHPTRPVCKVTFSQSGPTTIRPDLNSFLAWLHRSLRPELKYRTWMHVLMADRHPPADQKQEPFSSHILTGLESNFPNQPKDHTVTSTNCISRGSKISQTSKICLAVQLTSLLRFGLINLILDPTLVLDNQHLSSHHLDLFESKASAHHNLASFTYCFAVSACLLS